LDSKDLRENSEKKILAMDEPEPEPDMGSVMLGDSPAEGLGFNCEVSNVNDFSLLAKGGGEVEDNIWGTEDMVFSQHIGTTFIDNPMDKLEIKDTLKLVGNADHLSSEFGSPEPNFQKN
jgi:hypothetical protein